MILLKNYKLLKGKGITVDRNIKGWKSIKYRHLKSIKIYGRANKVESSWRYDANFLCYMVKLKQ